MRAVNTRVPPDLHEWRRPTTRAQSRPARLEVTRCFELSSSYPSASSRGSAGSCMEAPRQGSPRSVKDALADFQRGYGWGISWSASTHGRHLPPSAAHSPPSASHRPWGLATPNGIFTSTSTDTAQGGTSPGIKSLALVQSNYSSQTPLRLLLIVLEENTPSCVYDTWTRTSNLERAIAHIS